LGYTKSTSANELKRGSKGVLSGIAFNEVGYEICPLKSF